jgi:hypothetical protein
LPPPIPLTRAFPGGSSVVTFGDQQNEDQNRQEDDEGGVVIDFAPPQAEKPKATTDGSPGVIAYYLAGFSLRQTGARFGLTFQAAAAILARACRQISQIVAAARWSAARKFRAVLS